MKNHEIRNGKLIQTNKKFSHLKEKQKLQIHDWLKGEFMRMASQYDGKLSPKQKAEIVNQVYEKIEAHEIWIPYYEVEQYFRGKISRFTHQYNRDMTQG